MSAQTCTGCYSGAGPEDRRLAKADYFLDRFEPRGFQETPALMRWSAGDAAQHDHDLLVRCDFVSDHE
ncbi:MAG: hypothetical protein ACI9N0_000766 [Ilumatobacter sp.]|jgi:hypothetical protein